MRATILLLSVLCVAGCSSDGFQRTGYETLQNVGRRECLSDPGRNPADCYDRPSYNDYRNEQNSSQP